MLRMQFCRLVGCGLLALSAQPVAYGQSNFEPGDALSYKVGETDLYPSVRIDFLSNSNAYVTAEDPVTATDITLSPEVFWVADRRLLTLVGSYQGRYNTSSEDSLNFADHRLGLEADAELTARRRLSGELLIDFGHEPLGQNLTRGQASAGDDLVTFTDFRANGEFRYGANQARGNIAAGLELGNFDYNSRSEITSGRGYSVFEPYAEFSLRVSGDTRFVTRLSYATLSFEDSRRDRSDLSLLGGFNFAATGKTGGGFRVGVLQSQNKQGITADETVFIYQADLFWEPTSFSRFDFNARREIDNQGSSLVAVDSEASVKDTANITWTHSWSSRVSSRARVTSVNLNGTCPERDETQLTGLLEFDVQIRRWFSVGVTGSSTTRDVTSCDVEDTDVDLDFERSRVGAYIRATL